MRTGQSLSQVLYLSQPPISYTEDSILLRFQILPFRCHGNRGFFNKIFPTIWTRHTLFCSAPLYPEINNKWFLLNVISPRIKVVWGPILHGDESLLLGILFALDFPSTLLNHMPYHLNLPNLWAFILEQAIPSPIYSSNSFYIIITIASLLDYYPSLRLQAWNSQPLGNTSFLLFNCAQCY